MKKIYKKPLLTFIIGAIIFGTTGVLAGTFIAKDVTYDNSKSNINANNVQDAIDVLYTKANEGAPESYTGSYTYTPSTNTQTIYSTNKRFNDNITINPIPSSYKNLLSNTTATESDILNGKTAYNNLGELITGTTFLSNCAKGKINTSDGYSTSTDKLVTSIKPDLILLYPYDNTWATNYHLYYTGYSTTKFIGGDIGGAYGLYDFSDYYTINDNGWFIHNWPIGYNLSYIACAC